MSTPAALIILLCVVVALSAIPRALSGRRTPEPDGADASAETREATLLGRPLRSRRPTWDE